MDNNSNMLQLCRLCLVKDDVNIPIFEEQGDIRQIFLKISSCLPVKVSRDDRLPKKICDGCSYKLDMLYEFWNTSANAEKQLLTWLGEAGMTTQMADGTISAVAQQIKPADAFVKQETIDPPDIPSDDDDKDYVYKDKQEEKSKNNVDEPPPKRARRTAAVKAAIAMDQDSDDDDDSGEPMTKVEDDSDDSDNDDHEPAFVDVPSTSADDQPGPSGVGKDGVEAPEKKNLKSTSNYRKIKECSVVIKKLNIESVFYVSPKNKPTSPGYDCLKVFEYNHEKIGDNLNTSVINKISSDTIDKCGDRSKKKDTIKENMTDNDTKESNNKDIFKNHYKCESCNIDFRSLDDVKKHLNKKCKYKCKMCDLLYNTTNGFLVHILQHKIKNSEMKLKYLHTCKECDLEFADLILWKTHSISEHKYAPLNNNKDTEKCEKEIDEEDLSCELCFDIFNTKAELDQHMEFHKEFSSNNVLDDVYDISD